MNRDGSRKQHETSGRSRGADSTSSLALFRQVHAATRRVVDLQPPPAACSDAQVRSAFEELDRAYQELRAAEEHVHMQAEAIMLAYGALENERRRYRELFDAAPEAYLLTDLQGHITEANQHAAALLNIEEAFVAGKPLTIFIDAEDRACFRDALAQLERREHASFELRLKPRGESNPVRTLASVSRALDIAGRPAALRWLFRDLAQSTDAQRRLEERVSALESELNERTREVEAMKCLLEHCLLREHLARRDAEQRTREQHARMVEVANELRSPLSSIAGWLQMLGHGKAWPDAKQRAIASMTRNVRTLTRIVEDLIDHARAADGALKLELKDIELNEVLCKVVDDCAALANAKGVRLSAEPVTSTATEQVRVDSTRLRRALSNVVGNALRVTPAGGTVCLTATSNIQYVDVVVDGSCAATQAEASQSGEDTARDQPRARLSIGLEVARQLVELQGGSMTVDHLQSHAGTRVSVRLMRTSSAGASN
jgi:PAS domain S-box-containing protein